MIYTEVNAVDTAITNLFGACIMDEITPDSGSDDQNEQQMA